MHRGEVEMQRFGESARESWMSDGRASFSIGQAPKTSDINCRNVPMWMMLITSCLCLLVQTVTQVISMQFSQMQLSALQAFPNKSNLSDAEVHVRRWHEADGGSFSHSEHSSHSIGTHGFKHHSAKSADDNETQVTCEKFSMKSDVFFDLDADTFEREYVPHETSFMTFWTNSNHTRRVVLEFPLDVLTAENPLELGVGAVYLKGLWAHMDASDNDVALNLRLASNRRSVEVRQTQTWLIMDDTIDPDSAYITREQRLPAILARFHVLGHRQEMKSGECRQTKVLVKADNMLSAGVFVLEPSSYTYHVDSDTVRAHPENVVFTVHYSGEHLHSSSAYMQQKLMRLNRVEEVIRFCIFRLPEDKLPGRLADDRVGYFHNNYKYMGDYRGKSWSGYRPENLFDPTVRIIQRQRLKKLGDGQRGVVYYVDHSVPKPWRQAVKRGIELWKDAFLDVGFVIKALTPEDKEFPEDYDVGDVRYNTISWTAGSGRSPFAIGEVVTDPRSGEIMKANIAFTLGWLSDWLGDELFWEGKVTDGDLMESGDSLKEKLQNSMQSMKTPGFHRLVRKRKTSGTRAVKVSDDAQDEQAESPEQDDVFGVGVGKRPTWWPNRLEDLPCRHHGPSLKHRHPHEGVMCRALYDRSPRIWMMHQPTRAETTKFLEDAIADVTVHEVGHTLGLRHNFEASTAYALHQLQDPEHVRNKGLASSVMDYLPANIISSELRKQIVQDHFSNKDPGHAPHWNPKVGEYDKLAIQYGYKEISGERCCGVNPTLADIAARFHQNEMRFATDWDLAYGISPYVDYFDIGSEPSLYFKDRLTLVNEVQSVIFERAVRDKEPFTRMGAAQINLLWEAYWAGSRLAGYIGGVRISRRHATSNCVSSKPAQCLPAEAPGVEPVQAISETLQDDAAKTIRDVLLASTGEGIYQSHKYQRWSTHRGYEFYHIRPIDLELFETEVRYYTLWELLNPERLRMLWTSAGALGDNNAASRLGAMLEALSLRIFGGLEVTDGMQALSQNTRDPNRWSLQLSYIQFLSSNARCWGECGPESHQISITVLAEVFRLEDFLEKLLKHVEEGTAAEDKRHIAFLKDALRVTKQAQDRSVRLNWY